MVDSHTAIYSNPFLCKETNLLCLINSRWVSGSLIITKSFKIQVSLFILVTATLFVCNGQCDVKILCKTETLWGKLHFGLGHFGAQAYDVASASALGMMWDQKCQSSLLVGSPGWKETSLKTHQEVRPVPWRRTFHWSTYFPLVTLIIKTIWKMLFLNTSLLPRLLGFRYWGRKWWPCWVDSEVSATLIFRIIPFS